jgi:S1-C subfamily serine protease
MRAWLLVLLLLIPLPLQAHEGDTLYNYVLSHHVVLVETLDNICTGVAVRKDEILTAAHCVLDTGLVVDTFGLHYPFSVTKRSVGFDLALLHVHVPLKDPLPLAPAPPIPGTPVMAIGFTAQTGTITSGHADGVVVAENSIVVFASCAVKHGYSGGPLVTLDDQLAGLTIRVSKDGTQSMSVSVETVRLFLESK